MGKKIVNACIGVSWIFLAVMCIGTCRQYRQTRVDLAECQRLRSETERENQRLRESLSGITETSSRIIDDTRELGELNDRAVKSIDDCIEQVRDIRKKVVILETDCDRLRGLLYDPSFDIDTIER